MVMRDARWRFLVMMDPGNGCSMMMDFTPDGAGSKDVLCRCGKQPEIGLIVGDFERGAYESSAAETKGVAWVLTLPMWEERMRDFGTCLGEHY
nr:hypothetical protein CFP56_64644 [Quercus suber]